MFVPDGADSLEEGEILARQLSYFGPLPRELVNHVRDLAFCGQLMLIERGFGEECPRQPFREWEGVSNLDGAAKDFLGAALRLDPAARCTAGDLVDHPWLRNA